MGQDLCKTRSRTSTWAIVIFAILEFASIHRPASAQTVHPKRNVASAVAFPEIAFVQTRRLVWGPLARRFPQGSEIVCFHPSVPHGLAHLTEDFFTAADPHVSFDATRILFSPKGAGRSLADLGNEPGRVRQTPDHAMPAGLARKQQQTPASLPSKSIWRCTWSPQRCVPLELIE